MRSAPSLRNSGISGWQKFERGETPVVSASRIYWSALKTWEVLRPLAKALNAPNQSELHRSWPRLLSYDEGGDGMAPVGLPLFRDLPLTPKGWRSRTGELNFTLSAREADYVRERWRDTIGFGASPALLSKLAEAGVAPDSLWDPEVAAVGSEIERAALVRAREAASLVCIARAVYAALIERCRNGDLKLNDSFHADALTGLIAEHRPEALALDLNALRLDAPLDRPLYRFLDHLQDWLRAGGAFTDLHDLMVEREQSLKDDRAYLINPTRREDWHKGVAQPLDYRWPVVQRLITDLLEAE
jgi:hypothetical protein